MNTLQLKLVDLTRKKIYIYVVVAFTFNTVGSIINISSNKIKLLQTHHMP